MKENKEGITRNLEVEYLKGSSHLPFGVSITLSDPVYTQYEHASHKIYKARLVIMFTEWYLHASQMYLLRIHVIGFCRRECIRCHDYVLFI